MPDNLETILNDIRKNLGSISGVGRVSGGVVHYVYRLRLKEQPVFLKIRGDKFALAPGISTDKKLISNEATALRVTSELMPGYFPELIYLNDELGYMVISDALSGNKTLADLYEENTVSSALYARLGEVVGQMHAALNKPSKELADAIRDPQLDLRKLGYLTERLYTEDADNFYALYETHSRQFVHGDLSPKNILIKGNVIHFCDLDGFRLGVVELDQAWVVAHTLLHCQTKEQAQQLITAFFNGYEVKRPIGKANSLLIYLIVMALLYRLDNDLLVYDVGIGRDKKKIIARRMQNELRHIRSVDEIVDNFFLK